MTTSPKPIPRTTRRAVLAGGAALAVGAPTLTSPTVGQVPEPDAPLLLDCLAYLDFHLEADRLSAELDAVLSAPGGAGRRRRPQEVEAWRRVDEVDERSSDYLNRLCNAKATSILGVFAKAVAVGRFHLSGDDEEPDELISLLELMNDVVRLVRPSAGPLVRQILAHPALADVLGDEPATA